MIKVLIVEDSPVLQELISYILRTDPAISIAGVVTSGEAAIRFVKSSKPDVITMDINMPGLDGLETTRRIMQTIPVPIIIVSSLAGPDDTTLNFKAMEAGALAILPKPVATGHHDFKSSSHELITMVKLMSEIKVVKRQGGQMPDLPVATSPGNVKTVNSKSPSPKSFGVVAIGASTGGPIVIKSILSQLSPGFPFPILIVQHIATGFLQGFADWLAAAISLPLHVARHHDVLIPGHVYVAPDSHHMMVNISKQIVLSNADPVNGLRPCVSKLFESLLNSYGKKTIAVLLTGMGRDGSREMKQLFDCGAVTIAQDEASSVIYGMPGAAVELNGVTHILSPDNIADTLKFLANTSNFNERNHQMD